MPIHFNDKTRTFHLTAKDTSYIIHVLKTTLFCMHILVKDKEREYISRVKIVSCKYRY